jgi:hypothetical protein
VAMAAPWTHPTTAVAAAAASLVKKQQRGRAC